MRIAVIGSGVSGLGAAWSLASQHQVTLYEAGDLPGGHARTVSVQDRGRPVPVDMGFIVYNERNYPRLVRLLDTLGVETEPSDMSFSVSIGSGAFEYRARGLGLLAQPGNLARPSFLRMVAEIVRFSREARALVGAVGSSLDGIGDGNGSTGEWLERRGFSDAFRHDFLLPMVACIWSSSLRDMLDQPVATMAAFLDNHGLLDLGARPRWRTLHGGSVEYVRRIVERLPDVRLGTPVVGLERGHEGVTVRDAAGGGDRFDHAVLATHADTSLAILGEEASDRERRLLGAFRYRPNVAVLHRDPSFMPRRRGAWSSWNYRADARAGAATGQAVSLTYWMNLLQNLETERPVFVTLNPREEPRDTAATVVFDHPQYDRAAVDAQLELPTLQGRLRTWFCGSYHGYGFHEDGLRSGLEVASALHAPPRFRARVDESEHELATIEG